VIDGGAVDERTSSVGSTSGTEASCSPPSTRRMSPTARRPSSTKSWRTVVSGGDRYSASGMSSNPTTLTSPGTSTPCSCSARSMPSACWSFAQNTAVTSVRAANRLPAS